MSTQIQLPALERNIEVINFGAARIKEYRQAQLEQRLYGITNRLLTSLEVDRCVETFMQAVAEDLLFDGFHYSLTYPEPAINLHFGRQSRHKCSYKLNVENEILGELTIYRGRRFSESELKHLEKLLCVLVHPLRNAIMYRKAILMSQIDALTGLNNRAAYNSEVERKVSMANRHKRPLSLMVLDIDYFKKINDQYGHACGDKVLQVFAETLKEVTRDGDVVFRYGGEEFAILLSEIDPQMAMDVAERIRLSLKAQMIELDSESISATVSIGMATYENEEGHDSLFKRADKALYKAKESGRDQIQLAD